MVALPGTGYPLRVGFRVVDDIVNPYSLQGSFEIQREVGDYALSVAYNYNRRRPPDPAAGLEHLQSRHQPGHRPAGAGLPQPSDPAGQRVWQLGKIGLSRDDREVGEAVLGWVFDLCASHLEQGHGRGHGLQFVISAAYPVGRPERTRPLHLSPPATVSSPMP